MKQYVLIEFSTGKKRTQLAQSVERQPFKLVVVGSSPTLGIFPSRIVYWLGCDPFKVESRVRLPVRETLFSCFFFFCFY